MGTPVALQRVFIISLESPTRRVVEIDAMIVVTEKRTWAETPSGRRHQLGSTAFYTLASAERAKRGALIKIVATPALGRMHRTMLMYSRAQQQLMYFDQLGTFGQTRGGKSN